MVLLYVTPSIRSSIKSRRGDEGKYRDGREVARSAITSAGPSIDHKLIADALASRYGTDSGTPIAAHNSGQSSESVNRKQNLNKEKVAMDGPAAIPLAMHRRLELDRMLRGTGVHTAPKNAKPVQTQEYLELMERLRREEEEKQYYTMVPRPSFADPVKEVVSEVSSQIAAIFNVLFSCIFTGLAVWFATGMSGSLSRQITLRVTLSASTCVLVAVAEVVLYASYIDKVRAAATREKNSVELKEIRKTWKLGFDSEADKPIELKQANGTSSLA